MPFSDRRHWNKERGGNSISTTTTWININRQIAAFAKLPEESMKILIASPKAAIQVTKVNLPYGGSFPALLNYQVLVTLNVSKTKSGLCNDTAPSSGKEPSQFVV